MFRFEHPEGRSFLAVTLSHEVEELVFQAFREQRPIIEERLLTNPVDRVAVCKVWPQRDGNRVFVSIYEVTDLRRLERVRQDFVSNVSHELRTPLTIIRTMAETLLDEDVATFELRERYLNKIVTEVDRLSAISADLLTLSVAESNPVKKTACDIAAVFRGTLGELAEKAREKQMVLNYEGPEHLVIEANSIQMTQAALNLVENAINYTVEGSVTVRVRQVENTVGIDVTDTGIGIASEHLPRVFERFYRADKGRSRATGGTGLGLSIVKHIVEAHGGRVSVESNLNQGSTFTVWLPVGEPRREDVVA
jgi:two-component system phosphate regulon sensor histidine kinase PhoR